MVQIVVPSERLEQSFLVLKFLPAGINNVPSSRVTSRGHCVLAILIQKIWSVVPEQNLCATGHSRMLIAQMYHKLSGSICTICRSFILVLSLICHLLICL